MMFLQRQRGLQGGGGSAVAGMQLTLRAHAVLGACGRAHWARQPPFRAPQPSLSRRRDDDSDPLRRGARPGSDSSVDPLRRGRGAAETADGDDIRPHPPLGARRNQGKLAPRPENDPGWIRPPERESQYGGNRELDCEGPASFLADFFLADFFFFFADFFTACAQLVQQE
eukprot:gene9305-biopygen343